MLVVSGDGSEVPDALADYLRRFQPDWVVRYCPAVDLTADEIGVLSNNGVLQEIVPPSTRRLYWQQDAALTLQRIDTRDVRVPVDVMNAALQPRRNGALKGRDAMLVVQVPARHVGVVKIDGEIQALLPPGLTAYWKINHLVEAEVVDTRLQVVEVSGQEILTKDKVNLRLNRRLTGATATCCRPADSLRNRWNICTANSSSHCVRRSAPARSMSYWKISRSLMRWSANRCKAACHPLEWKLRRLG